jgi:hypothetical protein
MQSYYEINVAKDGRHLFATAERSATDALEADRLLDLLRAKFPAEQGYSVSCVYWHVSGRDFKGL